MKRKNRSIAPHSVDRRRAQLTIVNVSVFGFERLPALSAAVTVTT
jgi:hypothetical protein